MDAVFSFCTVENPVIIYFAVMFLINEIKDILKKLILRESIILSVIFSQENENKPRLIFGITR